MKKIILLLVTLFTIFTACEDDKRNVGENKTVGAYEREVEMDFISTPLADISVVSDDEDIAELDLVVCKNGIYQYTRPAYTVNNITYRSTLKIDENVDIYFFANCRSLLDTTNLLVNGSLWDDIQSQLILTYTDTIINNRKVLPMWGLSKNVTISDHTINNLGKIKLLRSVASANVYFNLTSGKSFIPKRVYVYFGADKAYATPLEENLVFDQYGLSGVTEPYSPNDMRTIRRDSVIQETLSFVNSIYMLENATTQTHSNPGNRRTRLVVGGHYDGSPTLTYYPLDFFETGRHDLIPVTRNHQYNLTITSVNSEGYPDPDEAAEQEVVNMEYEVISWDEKNHNHIIADGPEYLSVSKKFATLYKNAGNYTTISLSGTFRKEDIELTFHTSHNGTTDYLENGGIKNNRFKVEVGGSGTNLVVTVHALGNYSTTDPASNKDIFTIQAGRIKFNVEIEQITSGGWNNGGDEEIEF